MGRLARNIYVLEKLNVSSVSPLWEANSIIDNF